MMENGMLESKDGSATLHDVDKATFTRFVEFLMTGDYNPEPPASKTKTWSVPDGAKRDGPSKGAADNPDSQEVQQVTDDLGGFFLGHSWNVRVSPARMRRDACTGPGFVRARAIQKKVYPHFDDGLPPTLWCGHGQFLDYCTTCRPAHAAQSGQEARDDQYDEHYKPVSTHDHDFTNATAESEKAYAVATITSPFSTNSSYTFNNDHSLDHFPLCMSHAKLYVFADYYAVTALQILAADRLREALTQVHLGVFSNTSVVALIKYVYENTPDSKNDVLRCAMVDYAVGKRHSLRRSKEFHELLAEGGAFPVDVFEVMAR